MLSARRSPWARPSPVAGSAQPDSSSASRPRWRAAHGSSPPGSPAASRFRRPLNASASPTATAGASNGAGVRAAASSPTAVRTRSSSAGSQGVRGWRPSMSWSTRATTVPPSYEPSRPGTGAPGGSAAVCRASARCRPGLWGLVSALTALTKARRPSASRTRAATPARTRRSGCTRRRRGRRGCPRRRSGRKRAGRPSADGRPWRVERSRPSAHPSPRHRRPPAVSPGRTGPHGCARPSRAVRESRSRAGPVGRWRRARPRAAGGAGVLRRPGP